MTMLDADCRAKMKLGEDQQHLRKAFQQPKPVVVYSVYSRSFRVTAPSTVDNLEINSQSGCDKHDILMGDRSGGRESKGTSLKKSKKNPGASAARVKTAAKDPNSGPAVSLPAPEPESELYFDAGVALLSRQFDRDRDRVIARAKQDGDCCGMLVWFADIEKQTSVAEHCKTFSGSCFFATGIHPDNIDRVNKKSHDDWLAKVEELGKQAECVAILSGLNLSREIGTHFAQESLLKSSCALAEKLELPLILHLNNAASLLRAIEILRSEGLIQSRAEQEAEDAEPPRLHILLHDAMTCCEASVEHFKTAADCGMYFLLAATGLTDAAEEHAELRHRAKACAAVIPDDHILLCTDSPWKTPQNLPDPYLRTLRNEPSNIASIAVAIAEARHVDMKELSLQIRANSVAVFGLGAAAADVGEVTQDLSGLKVHWAGAEKADISTAQSPPQVIKKAPKPAAATVKAPSSKAFYSCQRCRARLFGGADIKAHTMNTTTKTVFKVGEEGLCASTLLFRHADRDGDTGAGAANKAVTIRGNSVECAECSNKLGKLYFGEANCGCGAIVPGPVIKVAASKVDFSDGAVQENMNLQSLQDLAQRAQLENAELQLQEAAKAAEEAERQQGVPKKEKKKKYKSENRGNYSMFRDKSFIRGASKTGKKDKGNSLELLQETLGVAGGEGSGDSEGSDEDK